MSGENGEKTPLLALVFAGLAVFLLCASFFVQGMQGSKAVEHGLTIGAVLAIAVSAWIGMRRRS